MQDISDTLRLAEFPFSSLAAQDKATIERLSHTCETVGFFIITDHPLSPSTIADAFAASRTFFSLPESVKMQYHQRNQLVTPKSSRGYSALAEERLGHPVMPPDYKQVFDLGIDRVPVPGEPFTGRNAIPNDRVSPNFSALLRLQTAVMQHLFWPIVRAMAAAMGLTPNAFDEHMKDPTLIQRTAYYPEINGTVQPHSDSGLFTLLFQETRSKGDGDRSLQVLSNGNWCPVEPNARQIVVNLGDHFALWSRGRFVSTLHRVLHHGSTSRVSMSMFFYPNINAEFVPVGATEDEIISTREVIVSNFKNIWEDGKGTGRKLTPAEQDASVDAYI